jgi:hypothetical protein
MRPSFPNWCKLVEAALQRRRKISINDAFYSPEEALKFYEDGWSPKRV